MREMNAKVDLRLPHIVVIGAGFAGLRFVENFPRDLARITLLDRQNHHLFQPLLYQVATASLSAGDITAPIRHIMRRQQNWLHWQYEWHHLPILIQNILQLPSARTCSSVIRSTVPIHPGNTSPWEYLWN